MITTTRTPLAALALLCAAIFALHAPGTLAAKADEPRVDLNTASATMLRKRLPGIGRRRAASIVAYREEHGPFKSVEALADVPGISERLAERVHPHAVVAKPAKRSKRKSRR